MSGEIFINQAALKTNKQKTPAQYQINTKEKNPQKTQATLSSFSGINTFGVMFSSIIIPQPLTWHLDHLTGH